MAVLWLWLWLRLLHESLCLSSTEIFFGRVLRHVCFLVFLDQSFEIIDKSAPHEICLSATKLIDDFAAVDLQAEFVPAL